TVLSPKMPIATAELPPAISTAASAPTNRKRPGRKPMEDLGKFREMVASVPDWESDPLNLACELDSAGCAPPANRKGERYRSWVLVLGDGSARESDKFRKAIRGRLQKRIRRELSRIVANGSFESGTP